MLSATRILMIMMLFFCAQISAKTTYELIDRAVRSAEFKLTRGSTCAEKAYNMLVKKSNLSGKYEKIQYGSYQWNIGYNICTFVGMQDMLKTTMPAGVESLYKASACTTKQAEKMGISDPMMINHSLYVIIQDAAGYPDKEEFFKRNRKPKKNLFPIKTFEELTNSVETMACNISLAEANVIHRDFVKRHFDVSVSDNCLKNYSFNHVFGAFVVGEVKNNPYKCNTK